MKTSAWLAAGAAQLVVALFAGVALAAGWTRLPPVAHVLLALLGFAAVLGGLAVAIAAPLARRDPAIPWLGALTLTLLLATDLSALRALVAGDDIILALRWPAAAMLLALAAHGPIGLLAGRRWTGDDVYAAGQPFARGDRVAGAALGLASAGLLAAAVLLAFPPRALPSSALVALAASLLALLLGIFAFLLPRHARAPLAGATLLAAALFVGAIAAANLSWSFATGESFRIPAAGWLAALLLATVALLRARLVGARAAKPLLASSAALAVLAGLALFLALAGDSPAALTGAAIEAHLVLLGVATCAALQLAAPLLWRKEPAPGTWTKVAPALAIASLFLLAPAFQYARSPFPGALLLGIAALLALLGIGQLAYLRSPKP